MPQTPLYCRHRPWLETLAMARGIRRDGTGRTGGGTTPPHCGGNCLRRQCQWRRGGRQSMSSAPRPQRATRGGHHNYHSRIPLVLHSPAQPLPILCILVLLSLSYSLSSRLSSSRHSLLYSPPPPPPHLPIPSSSAILLADSSLDSIPRNASANHKLVKGGFVNFIPLLGGEV
jgi:hypothetical protein